MRSPREKELFVTALRVGIEPDGKDYLAVVDVDPQSPTYSQVVHRVMMPHSGDELHHFGWNACASCHADPDKARRVLDRARLSLGPHSRDRRGRSAFGQACTK